MLLELTHVSKSYPGPDGRIDVLKSVSLAVAEGEAVGLVGESGSGKTTLIRCAMQLEQPDSGSVRFDGQALAASGLKRFRREAQLVFQDPYASLNPRMTIGDLVGEGLLVHGLERNARKRRARAGEMLDLVGLGQPTSMPIRGFFRRPASAHRHRARFGSRAAPARLRRTGIPPSTYRCRRRSSIFCATCRPD